MNPRLFCAAIGLSTLSLFPASAQNHPFSVKEDIAMARFSDPSYDPGAPGNEKAKPSPNGDYVAIVTTKGLIAFDKIESELSVFRMKDVSGFLENARPRPQPRVIAAIVSYPHREQTSAYAPVIKDVHWSSDGKGIYFRGENGSGAYQLYSAKLDGSRLETLTPATFSVDRFDVARDTIVYRASTHDGKQSPPASTINGDVIAATGARIQDVIFRGQIGTIEPETFSI